MSKPKIFWLSDSPLTVTGYATISRNILNGLSDLGWECHFQGHNYIGQTLPPGVKFKDGEELKFWLYGNGFQPYSKDLLVPRIRQIQPDIFGILLDTFMCWPWLMDLDFAPSRSCFYYPSDGGDIMPLGCENILRKVNLPVAMSKFAQKQVQDVYGIKSHYIPHAVDTKNYYPLSNEDKTKLRTSWGMHDKFVVGVVARNQPRKMLDRTFKAFAKFCKDKPEAVLLLHLDPQDPAGAFDIVNLITRLKINNRIRFTGMRCFDGFDYKQMNEVYNLMDVFFLSTSGEGFGVPIIEAHACGIPTVMTDYTTAQELIMEDGQCGEVVKVAAEITGGWNVERAIMDDDDAVEKLNKLYYDKKLREKYSEVGRKKAVEKYDWSVITPMWDELFRKAIKI